MRSAKASDDEGEEVADDSASEKEEKEEKLGRGARTRAKVTVVIWGTCDVAKRSHLGTNKAAGQEAREAQDKARTIRGVIFISAFFGICLGGPCFSVCLL